MRTLFFVAMAGTALLAGCSGAMDRGTIDTSPGMAGTSGGSGVDEQVVSPGRHGMGEDPTRRSLQNQGSAGSSAAPYGSTDTWSRNRTVSPNRHGMGPDTTYRSLPEGGDIDQ